jgi:hypothetical protein
MTLMPLQSDARFAASSTAIFQQYGVTLEIGYDFEIYRDHLKEARPEHVLGVPYDPKLQRMTENDSLWIIGRNRAGSIVHTQALRMLDMRGLSVGDYFGQRFREFPPSGVDLDLARSRYRAGPGAARMRGQVAYHGEFWIGGADKELRGMGLSCVLGRYGFWQAIQHWDPDHIVAFMARPVAFKGLAERTGWMHTEPGALHWFLRDQEKPIEGFLAYMHRDDLRYVLDLPLADLVAQAA